MLLARVVTGCHPAKQRAYWISCTGVKRSWLSAAWRPAATPACSAILEETCLHSMWPMHGNTVLIAQQTMASVSFPKPPCMSGPPSLSCERQTSNQASKSHHTGAWACKPCQGVLLESRAQAPQSLLAVFVSTLPGVTGSLDVGRCMLPNMAPKVWICQ